MSQATNVTLKKRMDHLREAQQRYATFSQEQVDHIFYQASLAANKARFLLAKMAVEETGRGIVEDKVIKNHYASEYIYNAYKLAKTCGVIEEDQVSGVRKIAEPMGVIGAVIPVTNPTSTTIFKVLIALKTRNAIMISSHPSAKNCTIEAARIIKVAAEAAGAPKGLIDWIAEPSLAATNELMQSADITLATGGPAMVKAAYSSGKPALGVGAGNTPTIIDDSADVQMAVNSIIVSKTFDNGMICASEQTVTVLSHVYEAVKAEFIKRGCAIFNDEKSLNQLRATIMIEGKLNAAIVGKSAYEIAKMAGLKVAKSTKILIGEVSDYTMAEAFAHEKLSPVLGMYRAKTFQQALAIAERLVEDGGLGHTAALYADPTSAERIDAFAARMKTCRVLLNTPASHGAIGDLYNFKLAPSLTLGCGAWGGNSTSDNVGIGHLLNIKTVAERRANMLWFRTPDRMYFKPSCTDEALRELAVDFGRKKAMIVTDQFLFDAGYTKAIEEQLRSLGMQTITFFDVAPDPTMAAARAGAKLMRSFQPDSIIAFGGGSPIDAAKIMWLLYEHGDISLEDMSMDFMDIRKRVYKFPKMGEKAFFVAIPSTAGSGSEVTPFAVITDEKTGIKYPLADYALMPNMAIVDANHMMNQPKSLTRASGIDVLTHAIEAYVSILASDFTDGLALQAIKLVFDNLSAAYHEGAANPKAREAMANASAIAGMAFANAFLGINHSMAHKLGAYHNMAHGIANALLMTNVMKYNAATAPTKMGTFSQYEYPKALERYAAIARHIGLQGTDDKALLEALIEKIEALKEDIEIPSSIKAYGIEEAAFKANLDEMVEEAWNDQCTGANPRYPLLAEMKELYLLSYYGHVTKLDAHFGEEKVVEEMVKNDKKLA